MKIPESKIPKAALILGSTGVLPFLFCVIVASFAHSPIARTTALQGFVSYGAVILSFLGGVRWGAALAFPSPRLLMLAIAPSLLAAGCLLIPLARAVPLLGLGFLVVGLFDAMRGEHALWPHWYKRLRLQLTIAVVALHIVLVFTPTNTTTAAVNVVNPTGSLP